MQTETICSLYLIVIRTRRVYVDGSPISPSLGSYFGAKSPLPLALKKRDSPRASQLEVVTGKYEPGMQLPSQISVTKKLPSVTVGVRTPIEIRYTRSPFR
jgi:hypothetical protein